MPRKILLIHPLDSTTKFLLDPISFFKENIGEDLLEVHVIEPDQQSHDKCMIALKDGKYDVIFYLGHGSSQGVQGSSNDSFSCEVMIDVEHLSGLKDKMAIFLSCNSNDFLKKSELNHIGFGFMPTDWKDIINAREVDYKAHDGVSEDDINEYCIYLTEILKQPIIKLAHIDNYTLKMCYNDIILRVNQCIALNYKNKKAKLAYLMYELKHDMVLR